MQTVWLLGDDGGPIRRRRVADYCEADDGGLDEVRQRTGGVRGAAAAQHDHPTTHRFVSTIDTAVHGDQAEETGR